MIKRIICLILVVVMLALSLVGCGGYSLAEDDLSKYASFEDGKEAFLEALLKNIIIKDGDFTENEATRADKVYDAMYEEIASHSTSTDKKVEGKAGEHDLVYYSYYITYKDGDKTVYIAPDYMKANKTVKLQLGKKETSALEKAIYAAMVDFDFTDKAYAPKTDGKALEGDVAYITYSYSYTVVAEDGSTNEVPGTVTCQRVVLNANDPIHKALISSVKEGEEPVGLNIGVKTSDKIEISDGYVIKGEKVNQKVTITDAKVEFVEDGALLCTFDDNSNVEKTDKVAYKNTDGDEVNVAGKVITYHVYASSYSVVDELNAANIITLIYGKENFKEDIAKKLVFGVDFADKTEEDQKALLDAFKLTVGEEEKDFSAAVTYVVELLTDYETKKKAVSDAETNLEAAEEDLAEVEEGDETGLATAQKNVEDCKAAVTKANEEFETATSKRDEGVNAFIEVEVSEKSVEELIEVGYDNVTYDEMQEEYREDIKHQLAYEILKLIRDKVVVSDYPTDLVDEVYDQLYNNYQATFYNDKYLNSEGKEVTDENGNKVTNYSYYNGSFRNYLKALMGVDSYKEARNELRTDAEELIKPVLQFTFVAKELGQTYTDEQYEEYRDGQTGMEQFLEYYYGYGEEQIEEYYSNARNALQLDKLLNYLLEVDETVDGRSVKDTYKNIQFAKN